MSLVVPHASAIVGLVCLVLALVFEIISTSTEHWIEGKHSYGLWKICLENDKSGCTDMRSYRTPGWVDTVRAFCVVSILGMVVCLGCFGLMLVRSKDSILHQHTALAAAFAGICSLTGFAVFAAKTRDWIIETDMRHRLPFFSGAQRYGYSFFFTMVASVLCLAASLLFRMAPCQRQTGVNVRQTDGC